MFLGARILTDVANVNSFEYTQTAEATEGDSVDLFIQLVDKSQDLPNKGFSPAFRRYMPLAGATLQTTLQSIDDAKTVIRWASQPFVQDASIWKITLLATDLLKGTFTLQLALNEAGKVTRGNVQQAISFTSLSQTFC